MFNLGVYRPENWYWVVGDDAANVWLSARAASVPVGDADYVAWLNGNAPTRIATMEELQDVLAVQYPPGTLETYATYMRDKTNGGGVVVNGQPFATDVITLGSLNSAYIYTQGKTGTEFSWKLPDGTWVTLSQADIEALQNAVSKFGQDCFDCEADVLDGIEAGTIIERSQIEAAFAAIPNSFTGVVLQERKKKRRK